MRDDGGVARAAYRDNVISSLNQIINGVKINQSINGVIINNGSGDMAAAVWQHHNQ